MEAKDADEFFRTLTDHGVTEVARVYTYSGYIEEIGKVTFRVTDLGRSPRWSVQAFNNAGGRLGVADGDSLSIAVMGVFNKSAMRVRKAH